MFFDSSSYRNLLIQIDYFNNFSLKNILLINSQNPHASMIAGKNAWGSLFKKGLSPSARPIDIVIPANVEGMLDYKKVTVFDIADTIPPSSFSVPSYDFKELFARLRRVSEYSFIYSPASFCKTIVIPEGTDEEKLFSAFHGLLEDESSEFIVAHHFGLDVSGFTFTDMEVAEAELQTIHSKAHALINSLEEDAPYFTFEETMLINYYLEEADRVQFLNKLYMLESHEDTLNSIVQSLIEKIDILSSEEYSKLHSDKFSYKLSAFIPYSFQKFEE